MNIIKDTVTDSYRDRGSKFIGCLFPISCREDFEEQLRNIKSEYPDATHHCYACRFNPADIEEFSQDDGEPGGTAGLPILNQMKSYEVVNAGLIVVRYFGGTKLGKSGLIEAYGHTAALCLDKSKPHPIRLVLKVEVKYPYSEQNTIERLIHQLDLTELDSNYMADVTLTLACPIRHSDTLKENLDKLAHLGIETEFLDRSYI